MLKPLSCILPISSLTRYWTRLQYLLDRRSIKITKHIKGNPAIVQGWSTGSTSNARKTSRVSGSENKPYHRFHLELSLKMYNTSKVRLVKYCVRSSFKILCVHLKTGKQIFSISVTWMNAPFRYQCWPNNSLGLLQTYKPSHRKESPCLPEFFLFMLFLLLSCVMNCLLRAEWENSENNTPVIPLTYFHL